MCSRVTKVSPSMLSADFAKFGEELIRVERAGADWVHIDVMDGNFVPNITIGPDVIRSVRSLSRIPFDVHLMIQHPENHIRAFAEAGADMLTIHVEAEGDKEEAIERIRESGITPGISLNPGTPFSDIEPYLDRVNLVLVMTVQPGFGGQPFREEVLPKICAIRDYAKKNGRNIEISVDGGINRTTGKRCVEAGATVLAAGSYLFKMPDMASEISLWKRFDSKA